MNPSGLPDSPQARLEPLLQEPREDRPGGGRARKDALRRVADALFHEVKTGCQRCIAVDVQGN